MTVQFALESVSSLPWNHCPVSSGIRVQFGVEYATNLIQREYSQSLAQKAVSIIRPEWAPTGRKPEE
jgi:hypothetical protein